MAEIKDEGGSNIEDEAAAPLYDEDGPSLVVQNPVHAVGSRTTWASQAPSPNTWDSMDGATNTWVKTFVSIPVLTSFDADLLTVQSAKHGQLAEITTLNIDSELTLQGAVHSMPVSGVELGGMEESDVLWADGDVFFEDGDVEFVPQELILEVFDSVHAVFSTPPVLLSSDILTVRSAGHGQLSENVTISKDSTLTVQDATHSTVGGNVTVAIDSELATHDALHDLISENATIAIDSELTTQDAVHDLITESSILSKDSTLTVQDATHSTVGEVVVVLPIKNLTVQDSVHSTIGENVTLSTAAMWKYAETFVINDFDGTLESGTKYNTRQEDNIDLVYREVVGTPGLSVTALFYNIPATVDNFTVRFNGNYDGNPAHIIKAQAWAFAGPDIGTFVNLTADANDFPSEAEDSSHNFYIEPDDYLNYVSGGEFRFKFNHTSPGNVNHLFNIDNFYLEEGVVQVQNTIHSHVAGVPAISKNSVLVVQDALHDLISENTTVAIDSELVTQDAVHGLISEKVAILNQQDLSVQHSVHGMVVDSLTLNKNSVLEVQAATHKTISENLTLSTDGSLVVLNSIHGMTVESVTLSKNSEIGIQSAVHDLISENVVLPIEGDLVVQDPIHGMTVNAALSKNSVLAVQDVVHGLTGENVTFVVELDLEVQNTVHGMLVDNVTTGIDSALTIQSSQHGVLSAPSNITKDQQLGASNVIHVVFGKVNLTGDIQITAQDSEHGLFTTPVVLVPAIPLKENFTARDYPYVVVSNDDEYFYTGRPISYNYITKKAA